MQTINLNDNTSIPILGFGTWELPGENARKPVEIALKTGYRAIDTATIYQNHEVIGEEIEQSGIKREELFLTSKLWRDDMRAEDVEMAAEIALEELKMKYLDLYLIHWPNKAVDMNKTLEEMGKLKDKGLIKAIGVSNFTIHQLEEALKSGVEITNHQVELHPSFNQKEMVEWCKAHKISVTAYSPLGQGKDLKIEILKKLAIKYKVNEAEVILAWIRQKGIIAIPRSSDEKHITDNFASLSLTLDGHEMEMIDNVAQEKRIVRPSFAEFED